MKNDTTDNNINSEEITEVKNENIAPQNGNDNSKGLSAFWKKTLIIIGMLIVLFGLIYACLLTYLNGFQFRSSGEELTPEQIAEFEAYQASQDALYHNADELDDITIGATPTPAPTEAPTEVPKSELRYILLIGIDSRSATEFEKASADVMKVLVIDEDAHQLKLISFMRDILVPIEGHYEVDGMQKYGKLNAVYFFNGPDGLCKTINDMFQIPVEDYVIINWPGVVDMVNAMGGVTVDVKASEISCINHAILVQNNLRAIEYTSTLYKNGPQLLNGNQALAYCRVRECGNGDFDRVGRQVVVLQSLFESIKTASFDEILALLDVLQNVVKTNIAPTELLKYAELGYGMLDADLTSMAVPIGEDGGTFKAGKYMGRYVLKLDFVATRYGIHDYIGDDIEIDQTSPLPE